jgi:hypothetical protein
MAALARQHAARVDGDDLVTVERQARTVAELEDLALELGGLLDCRRMREDRRLRVLVGNGRAPENAERRGASHKSRGPPMLAPHALADGETVRTALGA